MLLTIDIGNTNVTLGAYKNDDLVFTSRLSTDRKRTLDQYAVELFNIFKLHNFESSEFNGAIISSVVPEVTDAIKGAVVLLTNIEPVVLLSDIGSGLKIINDAKGQVGADIAAVSIGAICKYKLPCFILDLGTATKIILIDETGQFVGCTISAGIGISLKALSSMTSLLPSISIKTPESSIGTSTVECIQSGTIIGSACMLDGLTEQMEKDFGKEVKTIVATGGFSEEIIKSCKRSVIYDKNLILEGLKDIYYKMR